MIQGKTILCMVVGNSKCKELRLGRRWAGSDHKKPWRPGEGFALLSVQRRRHGRVQQGSKTIWANKNPPVSAGGETVGEAALDREHQLGGYGNSHRWLGRGWWQWGRW